MCRGTARRSRLVEGSRGRRRRSCGPHCKHKQVQRKPLPESRPRHATVRPPSFIGCLGEEERPYVDCALVSCIHLSHGAVHVVRALCVVCIISFSSVVVCFCRVGRVVCIISFFECCGQCIFRRCCVLCLECRLTCVVSSEH